MCSRCSINPPQGPGCWTSKSDLRRTSKCDQIIIANVVFGHTLLPRWAPILMFNRLASGAYFRVEHPKFDTLGKAPGLNANFRLCPEGLPVTNTRFHLPGASVTKGTSFIGLTPSGTHDAPSESWCSCGLWHPGTGNIKTFLFVSYNDLG